MSKSLNKCCFIGNLGADPEVRYTQDGTAVANFSIACTEKWKDGEHTEWVRLVVWSKLAEICGEHLNKGDRVWVEGSARTRKWQDNNGVDRYTTEYRVNDLIMLGAPGGSHSAQPRDEKPARQQEAPLADDFDDISF